MKDLIKRIIALLDNEYAFTCFDKSNIHMKFVS